MTFTQLMLAITGVPVVLHDYWRRIHEAMESLRATSHYALPENRALVEKLLGEGVFYACDHLLAGIHPKAKSSIHRNHQDWVLRKFSGFVKFHEDMLKQSLDSMDYVLDAPNTLMIIGNTGKRFDTVRYFLRQFRGS